MPRHQAKRIRRELTAEERKQWQQAQKETETEKDEILATGRQIRTARDSMIATLRSAFDQLKAEREQQGLSLSDIQKKSGIGRAALSRLENEMDANPTFLTLTRYAQALGKTLVVSLK